MTRKEATNTWCDKRQRPRRLSHLELGTEAGGPESFQKDLQQPNAFQAYVLMHGMDFHGASGQT